MSATSHRALDTLEQRRTPSCRVPTIDVPGPSSGRTSRRERPSAVRQRGRGDADAPAHGFASRVQQQVSCSTGAQQARAREIVDDNRCAWHRSVQPAKSLDHRADHVGRSNCLFSLLSAFRGAWRCVDGVWRPGRSTASLLLQRERAGRVNQELGDCVATYLGLQGCAVVATALVRHPRRGWAAGGVVHAAAGRRGARCSGLVQFDEITAAFVQQIGGSTSARESAPEPAVMRHSGQSAEPASLSGQRAGSSEVARAWGLLSADRKGC